jgi:tRNA pseudouridine55 synthase
VADVGTALGCGAHVARLVRRRIGTFDVEAATPADAPGAPLALERAVGHLPRIELSEEEAIAVGHGRILAPAGVEGYYGVTSPDGRLLGIYRDDGSKARPEVILAPSA